MENKDLVVLIVGFAWLLLADCSSGATPCAGNYVVIAPKTASTYGPRDKGRYCDGTVFVPDGGRLETVSASVGEIRGKPGTSTLHLRLLAEPLPSDVARSEIRLNAESYSDRGGYRFDARLGSGSTQLDVGRESALALLGMDAEEVGWLASIADYMGFRLVIPLVAIQNDSTVIVVVRPALHVTTSQYQLIATGHVIQEGQGMPSQVGAKGLYEFRIACGSPSPVQVKLWTTSPAGDVESDSFYLARRQCQK